MNKIVKGILIGAGAAAGVVAGTVGAAAGLFYAVAFKRERPKAADKILSANKADPEPTPSEILFEQKKEELKKWLKQKPKADMFINSEDGLRLYGQMLWAEKESMKTVVAVHGFHGEPAGDFALMIPYYHERGYNVLMVDDRAHRKSEGKLLGFGWNDRRDVVCWCKQLVRLFGEQAEILITGVSMGGATVMMASGEKDLPEQVKAIIEDCGYTSALDQFRHSFPKQVGFLKEPVLLIDSLVSRIANGYWLQKASSVKQLKKNTRPILFIHGAADDFVPTEMVYRNYEATDAEKQLLLVPGAEHACSCITNPELYMNTVSAFLDKYGL